MWKHLALHNSNPTLALAIDSKPEKQKHCYSYMHNYQTERTYSKNQRFDLSLRISNGKPSLCSMMIYGI